MGPRLPSHSPVPARSDGPPLVLVVGVCQLGTCRRVPRIPGIEVSMASVALEWAR